MEAMKVFLSVTLCAELCSISPKAVNIVSTNANETTHFSPAADEVESLVLSRPIV